MGSIIGQIVISKQGKEIIVGATAPSNPNADDLWLDTSNGKETLKRWNGSEWAIVSNPNNDINAALNELKNDYLKSNYYNKEETDSKVTEIIGETTITISGGEPVKITEALTEVIKTASENSSKISSVEFDLSNKVEISAFNEVKQTVDTNSFNISKVTSTTESLSKQTSDIEQNLNGFKSTVEEIYVPQIEDLQNKVDDNVKVYKGGYVPTLENEPAVNWINDAEKDAHIGDIFIVEGEETPEQPLSEYDENPTSHEGYYYRFESNEIYEWVHIPESNIYRTLSEIQQTSDKINLLVKDGDQQSSIELTDDAISFISSNINITDKNGNKTIINGGILETSELFSTDIIFSGKLYSSSHNNYDSDSDGIYIGTDYVSFGSGGKTHFAADGSAKIGGDAIVYKAEDDTLDIKVSSIMMDFGNDKFNISELGSYISFGTDEPSGSAYIELGYNGEDEEQKQNASKLRILNNSINFIDPLSSEPVAYIRNDSLDITNAIIKKVFQIGGLQWSERDNGNVGLVWKSDE